MKILLVGDIHGNRWDLKRAMNHAADIDAERVFFLGDFGWVFDYEFMRAAEQASNQTGLYVDFLDGNHDDFDFILSHEVAEDGYRYLSDCVRHIPRGTVLDLDGKNVMVMGGATSIDRIWRTPHYSWWPQEVIGHHDMVRAGANLARVGKVDAIFAHDGPVLPDQSNKNTDEILAMQPDLAYDMALSDHNRAKLAALMNVAQPKYWYHGHHHTRFTTELDTWYGTCTVECLDRDGTKISDAMAVVYTEDWV